MSALHTMDQIMGRLCHFSFFTIKSLNSKGRRRYECEIRQDEGRSHRKVYRGSSVSYADACRLAITRADDGLQPQAPKLRLA